MASLQQLKTRIKSVKSTNQLTKAMQTVASMRFRKNSKKAVQAYNFADKVTQNINLLFQDSDADTNNVLVKERQSASKILFVVISPSRGFCGGLHRMVSLKSYQYLTNLGMDTENENQVEFIAIGKPALKQATRLGGRLIAGFENLNKDPDQYDILAISELVYKLYTQDESISKVMVAYLEYPAGTFKVQTLLPVDLSTLKINTNDQADNSNMEIDTDSEKLLEELAHQYLQSQVFGAIWQTFASEEKARMVAMNQASDNAKELLKKLQLNYFRSRQAKITQDMSEIIAGMI